MCVTEITGELLCTAVGGSSVPWQACFWHTSAAPAFVLYGPCRLDGGPDDIWRRACHRLRRRQQRPVCHACLVGRLHGGGAREPRLLFCVYQVLQAGVSLGCSVRGLSARTPDAVNTLQGWLVDTWVKPKLASLTNLRVLYRAVVKHTHLGPDGTVKAVTVIQRTPTGVQSVLPCACPPHSLAGDGGAEWSARLSDDLEDWYTPTGSLRFTKQVLPVLCCPLPGGFCVQACRRALAQAPLRPRCSNSRRLCSSTLPSWRMC